MEKQTKNKILAAVGIVAVIVIFTLIFRGMKFISFEAAFVLMLLVEYFYIVPVFNYAVYNYYDNSIDGDDIEEVGGPLRPSTFRGFLNRYLPLFNETRTLGKYSRMGCVVSVIVAIVSGIIMMIPTKMLAKVVSFHFVLTVAGIGINGLLVALCIYLISTGFGFIKLKYDIDREYYEITSYIKTQAGSGKFVKAIDAFAPFLMHIFAILPIARIIPMLSIEEKIDTLQGIGMTVEEVQKQMEDLYL